MRHSDLGTACPGHSLFKFRLDPSRLGSPAEEGREGSDPLVPPAGCEQQPKADGALLGWELPR